MSRRRFNRPSAPYFTTAKYAGTCAETGAAIAIGANILYHPAERKVYCENSKSYREFADAEFDRIYLAREY